MQNLIDTLNANIAQATADATQQQVIINQAQDALNVDTANIAMWTAQLAIINAPAVQAAINQVSPPTQ